MHITPSRINIFLLFKLPLGWISGMRVKELTDSKCLVKIKHRWINQNPFKSMFWAAQGMAAELSTGVLVMNEIKKSKKNVSMLVTHQEANFLKKATGTIIFTCNDGFIVKDAIKESITTGNPQIISLHAKGHNGEGIEVSNFTFQWSLKVK